jgi:gliding motility-associated-like protein
MKNFHFRSFIFMISVLPGFTSAYAHYHCDESGFAGYYTGISVLTRAALSQRASTFNKIQPADGDTIAYQGRPVICSGGQISLTAANPGANSSFQWFKDPSGSPIATTATYVATSAGTYKVMVTTDGVTSAYPSLTVTMGVNPVAGFTSSVVGTPCSSTSIQFTNTSTSSGGNLSYSWDFGDPNSKRLNKSTVSNPTHLFVGTPGNGIQTFTVTLTVTSGAGCSSVYQSDVTLEQSPDTKLGGPNSVTYDAKPYFVSCTNAPTTFTFINQSTTDNVSYHIIWGDGAVQITTANFTTLTHTYRVGSFIMGFTVYGKNGCSLSTKYRIFVGTSPTIGLDVKSNKMSLCAGSSMIVPVLKDKTNTAGTTYLVSYSDNTINNYTSPPDTIMHTFLTNSVNASTTKQGQTLNNAYSAVITASNPCGSASDTIAPIYVSDLPKSSFTASSNVVCVGSPVSFTNTSPVQYYTSVSGAQLNNFVWKIVPSSGYQADAASMGDDKNSSDPSLWVPGQNNLNITFTKPGNYKIVLKTGNPQCGIDTVFETICVNPAPISSFNIDNAEGCAPLVVHTGNTSNSPVCGTGTFQWSVSYSNDGCSNDISDYSYVGTSTSTSENPVIQFNSPGIYTLTLTNSSSVGGCVSAAFSQTIVIKAKPVISLQIPDVVYKDQSIKPMATIKSCFSTTAPSGVWTFNGGVPFQSTSLNPDSILFSTLGKYLISLTVTNDCGVTVVSKMIDVILKPTMFIPNTFTPNSDGINDTWQFKGLDNEPLLVNVFNRYGSLIYQSKGYYQPWDGLYNGKRLPVGVYYYVINTSISKKKLTGWVSIIY